MKLFLAGIESSYTWLPIDNSKYVLSSYAYMNKGLAENIHRWDMFLLDSGAFTFRKKSGNVDWNDYIDGYIEFILKHDVDYFFELDIDNIIGYENVLILRKKLEQSTGKKCIPVWHRTRGIENYIELCKTYDYIALGSSTKYKNKENHNKLRYLLRIARQNNCKVHGLGFTSRMIKQYDFYSVDSTTWDGYRYGSLYRYNNGNIAIIKPPKGSRLIKDYKTITINNFLEWCKYQRYLENHKGAVYL